jgi:5'-3' exonuclease
VVATVLGMLEDSATHVGVATDHVIESFRNGLWPGYKSSAGMPEALLAQFPLVEEALFALGVKVWPMVDLEADDAMASAAAVAADDPNVEQVAIWTPDKDLGQCVRGTRVVQVDRRNKKVVDEEGVIAKFGVPPASIPDYLALVGDSADGFPGLPGFGAKSAAAVLRRFGTIEAIPDSVADWDGVNARGAPTLAATLASQRDLALLFKDIATLRVDYSLLDDVSELEWHGPTAAFEDVCKLIDADGLLGKAKRLSRTRPAG